MFSVCSSETNVYNFSRTLVATYDWSGERFHWGKLPKVAHVVAILVQVERKRDSINLCLIDVHASAARHWFAYIVKVAITTGNNANATTPIITCIRKKIYTIIDIHGLFCYCLTTLRQIQKATNA